MLEPPETAALDGVCELIASQAQMPEVKPFRVCGTDCLSAGAFLTIRTALSNEGIPVDGIRPSTPLGPLARKHLGDFLGVLGKIAPDALPVPEVKYRFGWRLGWWLMYGGFIGMIAAWLTHAPNPWLGALVSTIVGYLLLWCYRKHALKSVSFHGLRTFRDLAEEVVRWT